MKHLSLTTDFGTGDFEIGTLSGVIYSIAPDTLIADLTHDIPPQNILDAAVVLSRHTPYFPEGSIHVVVVDPGVGTTRRPIAARLGKQYFVGPDNGVMTLMYKIAQENSEPIEVVHTDDPQFWLPNISNIFHGRDIFAAVAGHLAAGVPLRKLGTLIDDPVLMDLPDPEPIKNGLRGQILRVDHFGNMESNIHHSLLKDFSPVSVRMGDTVINGLVETFGQGKIGELVAMIDSSGVISVCVVNGNAAHVLNAKAGDPIEVFSQAS
jgi:S-adenosylmethionine hydrolase